MKGRIAIVTGIALAGIAFTVWLVGIGYPLRLFDWGAFVIAVVLPVLAAGVVHDFSGFGIALGVAFDRNAERHALERSKAFLSTYTAYLFGFGFIGFTLGMISLFMNLEDRTKLGPMLALMCFSLLYAATLFVVFVLPLASSIRAKLALQAD